MADGINMTDGFSGPKQNTTSPWGTENYAGTPAAAFPAKDMSTQGNSGLNQEGSAGANESGADFSDAL